MAKLNTLADRLKRIQDNRELTNLRNQIASVPQADDTALREATARAQNAMNTPFTYNHQNDPSYKALYDAAVRNGQLAMKDTMGKATALTGGYANSYAQQVGQQTYNDYMSKLNEQIPALENAAYQRYRQGIADAIQSVDLEKLLYGAAVDRRNEKVSEAQNMYNNLYKVVGDDTDAYNKALATDVGLANIPYENQQKIDLQTAIDRMQMQNNIAENKAKNADDLAYQKALVDYKNSVGGGNGGSTNNSISINNGNGGTTNSTTNYKYTKGTSAYNTAFKSVKEDMANGDFASAGDTIGGYIKNGYADPNEAIPEYTKGLTDAVRNNTMSPQKATNTFKDWLDKYIMPIGTEEAYEFAVDLFESFEESMNDYGNLVSEANTPQKELSKIYNLVYQNGDYMDSYAQFIADIKNGRIKVTRNGKIL